MRISRVIRAICLTLATAALVCAIGHVTSSPTSAWADGTQAQSPFDDALVVDLDDGAYLIDVSLEGGTGRATVSSPARLDVAGGKAAATIEWSSPNYDYMVVNGITYLPLNQDGNSTFQIPLLAFDEAFEVTADTTAMSVPHEIDYQLTFDRSSIVNDSSAAPAGMTTRWILPIGIIVAIAVGLLILRRHRGTSGSTA